jgi:arginyl-tRNA synthetase
VACRCRAGLGSDGGSDEDVSDLQQLYRAAKKRFDEEEDFKVGMLAAGCRLQAAAWRCC